MRVVLLAMLFVLITPHDAIADATPTWTKIDDADGIAIYRREVRGSDVIAFKGEAVVAAPLVRVASAIFDTSRAPEWIESLVGSTFVLTPTPDGKGTRVSGDLHCDPRGSVPSWLVNYFQKDWPRSTFKRLRTQVAKPNVIDNPVIQRLVTPPAP